jgi:hypothetical protein
MALSSKEDAQLREWFPGTWAEIDKEAERPACSSCGRPSLECSRLPCPATVQDRSE